MSEKFSPALRLADLNDFIAPSQSCIISSKETRTVPPTKPQNSDKIGEAVKISLKDCLACSGCITSAETVMLQKQSLEEFLSHVESEKIVIVSISPQSRASLATYFGLSPSQMNALEVEKVDEHLKKVKYLTGLQVPTLLKKGGTVIVVSGDNYPIIAHVLRTMNPLHSTRTTFVIFQVVYAP